MSPAQRQPRSSSLWRTLVWTSWYQKKKKVSKTSTDPDNTYGIYHCLRIPISNMMLSSSSEYGHTNDYFLNHSEI